MLTLDTAPDRHTHQHQEPHPEPPAAFTPFSTPSHPHQHTCQEERPLAVLCGDLHHHPKGTIDTIDLVGASITVVYVNVSQMRVLYHSGVQYTPFLQLPTWPQYLLFYQYLTQTARATGNRLPDDKDMKKGYQDFRAQHLCPVPATAPYIPVGSKQGPVPPVTGKIPPLTLPLAPNEANPTQTTVIRHGATWRTPKHNMTPQDLLAVSHHSKQMPRTSWAYDLNTPTTPWPALHTMARHDTSPTTHLPQQAYALVAR